MTRMTLWRTTALSLAIVALASCGGDGATGEPAAAGSTQAPDPLPANTTRNGAAAIALTDAPLVHLYMATGPVMWSDPGRPLSASWREGRCATGSGSSSTVLDGAAPPEPLPTGSHTLSTTFRNCLVDGLLVVTFDGTATLSYSAMDWSSVVADVRLATMRTTGEVRGNLDDVTGQGAGTWSRTFTPTSTQERYSPAVDSTLTNNRTTRTITFQGGSISTEVDTSVRPPVYRLTYADLAMDVNGVRYVLNGTLTDTLGAGSAVWSGEVRITASGVLVARVYGESRLLAETFAPIETF